MHGPEAVEADMKVGPLIVERFANKRPRFHVWACSSGVQLRVMGFGLLIGWR